jgi:hypothetical protein
MEFWTKEVDSVSKLDSTTRVLVDIQSRVSRGPCVSILSSSRQSPIVNSVVCILQVLSVAGRFVSCIDVL